MKFRLTTLILFTLFISSLSLTSFAQRGNKPRGGNGAPPSGDSGQINRPRGGRPDGDSTQPREGRRGPRPPRNGENGEKPTGQP